MNDAAPQRIGASWFLGFVAAALLVVLWARGAGRLIVPALLLFAVGYGVHRLVQKIREPLP